MWTISTGPRCSGARPPRPRPPASPDLLARTQEPAIERALIEQTARAVAAGVVGAPTMSVVPGHDSRDGELRGDLSWGQDRLLLAQAAAPA